MCCVRFQSIVKFIEIYFRVELVYNFVLQGSPRDVDVKFLNMQSKMVNSHCLLLAMKILRKEDYDYFNKEQRAHTKCTFPK